MDAQKEFIEHVNSAVKAQCQAGPGKHKGEEIVVVIPVPREFLIDCGDVSGIDLDNVRISILEGQEFKDGNGNVVASAAEIGAVFYKVTGLVR